MTVIETKTIQYQSQKVKKKKKPTKLAEQPIQNPLTSLQNGPPTGNT
jgi:hypothetical protein